MSARLRGSLLGLATLLTLPAVGAAQKRPVELGFDGGIRFGLTEPKTTLVSLPIQQLRVGLFVSDRVSLEPGFGFNYIKPQDGDSFTQYEATFSALFHFSADVEKRRFFVRPIVGLDHASSGGDGTTQFSAGAGIGLKTPLANRLAFRLEALLSHGFEKTNEAAAYDQLGVLVGFSFFTR